MNTGNSHPGHDPARDQDQDQYINSARIDVSHAEIVTDPASRAQARALAYALVVLFITAIAIGGGNFLFTNSQDGKLRSTQAQADRNSAALSKEVLAGCGFYRDSAALPITVSTVTGKAAVTVPKIISDARAAFRQSGCPGMLPPPGPAYVKWAAYYHLPLN